LAKKGGKKLFRR